MQRMGVVDGEDSVNNINSSPASLPVSSTSALTPIAQRNGEFNVQQGIDADRRSSFQISPVAYTLSKGVGDTASFSEKTDPPLQEKEDDRIRLGGVLVSDFETSASED